MKSSFLVLQLFAKDQIEQFTAEAWSSENKQLVEMVCDFYPQLLNVCLVFVYIRHNQEDFYFLSTEVLSSFEFAMIEILDI